MTVQLTIDDKIIRAQSHQTILSAAQDNGITIPTLCYHKDLSRVGSCRLCLVEIDGWRGQVAACTTEVQADLVVKTNSPTIIDSRKEILSLLLENYSDSPATESIDSHETEFIHWLSEYHIPVPENKETRFAVDCDPNPFVWVDMNKCILCTRCVRACAEIQGRFVWASGYRGSEARIVAGADSTMLEARCESCGACVAYCPTGALENKMSLHLGIADRLVTTTCSYCGVGCQFDLNVINGKVIRVTSNPQAAVNGMHLCVKGRYGYDFIHHPQRLKTPLVRRYLLDGTSKPADRGEWVETDWDTALSITSRKIAETARKSGADSIGLLTSAKCTNEENYLMNKLARQVIGTHNIDHCARL